MTIRESIVLFELDVPRCSRTYGVAPCAAVLGTTGPAKCFNSRKTCQDPANLSLTETVTLRFARPQEGILQYGPVLPAIEADPSTRAMTVNLAGMEKSLSALGRREEVSVKLQDFQYSDLQLDKYRLERKSGAAQADGIGYDPFTRGTFWGKFLARHPYYTSYSCRVREGYIGDALADMRVRNYIADSIAGPTNGTVTVKAKDLFSLVESRKAVAPPASTAVLDAGISAVATAATLSPAGIGDLEFGLLETIMGTPGAGYVTIGDEICAYTRIADALTLTRAQKNTEASTHDADDSVQWNLVITPSTPQAIIALLLESFSEVPAESISLAAWDAAVPSTVGLFSRHIAKPEPVGDLLGQVCELAGLTLWPDVSTNMIELRALRAAPSVDTIDDEKWILDESFSWQREEQKRVSRVVVHYAQKNPLDSLTEQKNYGTHLVMPTDGATLYGTESVRDVWAPWIPAAGRALAEACGNRLTAMFKDPPIAATLTTNSEKASVFGLAAYADLEADEIQDFYGSQASATVAIISMKRNEEETTLELQQVAFGEEDDGVRRIFIDEDSLDVNLRELHDTLFPVPVGTEVVEATLSPSIFTGSSSTATAGLRTGDWPAGVDLTIVINGDAVGKGGKGGKGGNANGNVPSTVAGANGEAGGPAFEATYPVTVDGTGAIRGGGGGGPGGGGAAAIGNVLGNDQNYAVGGSGGGSGRGYSSTTGGARGTAVGEVPVQDGGEDSVQNGNTGGTATKDAKGTGGAAVGAPAPERLRGGKGGNGGDWGTAGSAGGAGVIVAIPGLVSSSTAAAGTPGAAGPAVIGNAFITWAPGNEITIDGALT